MGAQGRRRGGAASVEHPRQRVRGRHRRFHGRHAGDSGPGRSEPGRLRLPGDDRAGRAVEDRPAQAGRPGALPRDHAGAMRGGWKMRSNGAMATLGGALPALPRAERDEPVLRSTPAAVDAPAVVCRADGDKYLLVEYGPNVLDLNLRFRVHAAGAGAADGGAAGAFSTSRPACARCRFITMARACRGRRCSRRWTRASGRFRSSTTSRCRRASCICRCRWDDPATQLAIAKYMQSVRPDAPWCPSNIEFIRRINGLGSVDEVQRTCFRRELPGAGAGRRLSRRAGGDAARSAASAGDDEVQPGAHVDAGERGRHRRRVHVRVRHGGAGRLSVRRPDGADVEHAGGRRGVRAGHAVAAALLRPDPLLPGERGGAAGDPRGVSVRRLSAADGAGRVPAEGLPRVPASRSTERRAHSEGTQQEAFDAERERWAQPGAIVRSDRRRRASRRCREEIALPEGCRPCALP